MKKALLLVWIPLLLSSQAIGGIYWMEEFWCKDPNSSIWYEFSIGKSRDDILKICGPPSHQNVSKYDYRLESYTVNSQGGFFRLYYKGVWWDHVLEKIEVHYYGVNGWPPVMNQVK